MEYRSKFSYILDFIFKSVSVFVISFIWIRFFEHNITLIFIYSSIITLVVITLSTIRTIKKCKNENLSKLDFEKKENSIYQLNFYSQAQILTFFSSLLNSTYEVNKKNDYLILKKEDEKIGVFLNFNFNNTDAIFIKNIMNKINLNKFEKVFIYSNDYTKECKELCSSISNVKFSCKNSDEVFKLMKQNNIFPKDKVQKQKPKKKNFNNFCSVLFNKSKTKTYFFTGLIFLISSIFMRYNIYYLIFTTLMFFLSMYSYFNKRFNKKET